METDTSTMTFRFKEYNFDQESNSWKMGCIQQLQKSHKNKEATWKTKGWIQTLQTMHNNMTRKQGKSSN